MTQKNGKSLVLTAKVYVGMKHIAWNLLLVAQSSSVERRVVPGLVRHLWWDIGGMFCLVNSRHLLAMLRKKSYSMLYPSELGPFSSGYGNANEHAVISSFPVSAVGGTCGPPVISSFSAEVTAPSPSSLRNVTSMPESPGESCGTNSTRTTKRLSFTPCTGCSLWSRAGVTGHVHQQKET